MCMPAREYLLHFNCNIRVSYFLKSTVNQIYTPRTSLKFSRKLTVESGAHVIRFWCQIRIQQVFNFQEVILEFLLFWKKSELSRRPLRGYLKNYIKKNRARKSSIRRSFSYLSARSVKMFQELKSTKNWKFILTGLLVTVTNLWFLSHQM